jgi:hypothetical protein
MISFSEVSGVDLNCGTDFMCQSEKMMRHGRGAGGYD